MWELGRTVIDCWVAGVADVVTQGAISLSRWLCATCPGIENPSTDPRRYGEHEALRLAKQDGMDWLLHLDPDELLHPGEERPIGGSNGLYSSLHTCFLPVPCY